MKFPVSLLAFAALLIVPHRAHSALIGSYTFNVGAGNLNPAQQVFSLRFSLGPGLNCFNLGECLDMFSINGLTAASIGTTTYFGPLNTNFAAATARLTDGNLNDISITTVLADAVPPFPGGGALYSEAIFGAVPGPDFVGSTIGLIAVRIDNIYFSVNPFIDFTLVNYYMTFSVYDADGVPAPELSSAGLVAIGLAMLVWRRFRFRPEPGGAEG